MSPVVTRPACASSAGTIDLVEELRDAVPDRRYAAHLEAKLATFGLPRVIPDDRSAQLGDNPYLRARALANMIRLRYLWSLRGVPVEFTSDGELLSVPMQDMTDDEAVSFTAHPGRWNNVIRPPVPPAYAVRVRVRLRRWLRPRRRVRSRRTRAPRCARAPARPDDDDLDDLGAAA